MPFYFSNLILQFAFHKVLGSKNVLTFKDIRKIINWIIVPY